MPQQSSTMTRRTGAQHVLAGKRFVLGLLVAAASVAIGAAAALLAAVIAPLSALPAPPRGGWVADAYGAALVAQVVTGLALAAMLTTESRHARIGFWSWCAAISVLFLTGTSVLSGGAGLAAWVAVVAALTAAIGWGVHGLVPRHD